MLFRYKQRIFYETMEEILPEMKVIIERSDGSTQTMLPLEPFATSVFSTVESSENSEDSEMKEE